MEKLIVIGAGVSGLTAALYASRANLSPLVFAGNLEHKGGLLVKTSIVENFPGFPDGILGFDLMKNIEDQAKKYGAKIIDNDIVKVDFSEDIKKVYDNKGNEYKAYSIIIATGSTPNKLGLPNEDKFWAAGISSCSICDGSLFKKKKIFSVGGRC